jgi:hypothetical protein
MCPVGSKVSTLMPWFEHQVLDMLISASQGTPQEISDPSPILPYIGLYTMVHLKPDELVGLDLLTARLPELSILSNHQWIPAPAHTSPSAPNTARIFDARALATTPGPRRPSHIPLSADDPGFFDRQFWRLPLAAFGGILSAIMLRAANSPSHADNELRLARSLLNYLSLQKDGLELGNSDAAPGGSGATRRVVMDPVVRTAKVD